MTPSCTTAAPKGCWGTTPLEHRKHYCNPKSRITRLAIKIIAKIAIVAAGTLIGFCIGGLVGAAIGCAIGVALVGMHALGFHLYRKHTQHQRIGPVAPNQIPHTWENVDQGNKVSFLSSGQQTIEAKFKLMEEAKQSIELSANFAAGPQLDKLLDLAEQKLKIEPGIKLHFILSSVLISIKQKKRIKQLNKTYRGQCQILTTGIHPNFHRDKASTTENHAKILVVDEKLAVIGDSGFEDFYAQNGYEVSIFPPKRDLLKRKFLGFATNSCDLLIQGPLVKQMREEYFRLHYIWEARSRKSARKTPPARYFPLDENLPIANLPEMSLVKVEKLQFFGSDPDCPFNPITDEYVRLINAAEKTIHIANMEFSPSQKIKDALKKAEKRHVNITLFTNSGGACAPLSQLLFCPANRMNYGLANQVYEFYVKNILLHQKTMVVDGKRWIVGSYNCGPKSARFDYESAVSGQSTEIGKAILDNYEIMKNYSNLYEGEEKKKITKRPFHKAFLTNFLLPMFS